MQSESKIDLFGKKPVTIILIIVIAIMVTAALYYQNKVTNYVSKDLYEKGLAHIDKIFTLQYEKKHDEIPNEINSFEESIHGMTFEGNDKIFIEIINKVDSLYDDNFIASMLDNISDELDQYQTELKISLLQDEGKKLIRDKKVKKMLEYNSSFDNRLKEISSENMDKLVIVDGWKWENEGDYTYVRGSVKNISDYPIDYFKVTAEYMDSTGNVLDTDYTNSGEIIRPGNQKEFEIMHKDNSEYAKVRIFIDEGN